MEGLGYTFKGPRESADSHVVGTNKMASSSEHPLFKSVRVVQHMILPPSYIGRIGVGVIEDLNRRILKFSSEHQGFILAYSKPRVLQRAAVIHDEQSGLHFDVQTDLYLFAPKVGSILQGTVNHIQNTTHVGCLVYGCFNATVLRRSKGSSKRKNGMERGQSITFKVVNLEKVSGVLCILGQEVKQKRRNYNDEEDIAGVSMLEQQSSQDIDGESYSNKKKAKKKKKRKKDTQSHSDTLLSSLSASDVSHSERTPGNAFPEPSKRKRRQSDRDAASTSDASPAKAKRGRHLQDDEGSQSVAVETCKGGERGLNSNFSEATNAVEHRTKSEKKHKMSSQKKHRRKHSHCQE